MSTSHNAAPSTPELVRINVDAQQALLGDKPLRLAPREFSLLAFLAANAGQVVPREQAYAAVWNTTWLGVGWDKSLVVALMRVRQVLGDDAANPRYITTVPRKGLRFETALLAPAQTRTVDIDGRRYNVLHWETHPGQDGTATFTLHAREVTA